MAYPFIWAHRGASSCTPENTMAAFVSAVEAGADGLELDIHLSYDGVPVVIHDETLDRTTDGRGAVSKMTLLQLQRLDAGGWFSGTFAGESIPTLEEVLTAFGGVLRLNLELKEFQAGIVVFELLKRFPEADIILSSFDCGLLKRLRAVSDDLPLAVLFEKGNWHRAVQIAKDLNAVAFHPALDQVSRPLVAACVRANLPVSVWTVDQKNVARSLLRAGVSGLFTNEPTAMRVAFPVAEIAG